jgi:hypothetical protein
MWIVVESVPFDYDDYGVLRSYGPYESEAGATEACEKLRRVCAEDLEKLLTVDPRFPWTEYNYEVVELVMF